MADTADLRWGSRAYAPGPPGTLGRSSWGPSAAPLTCRRCARWQCPKEASRPFRPAGRWTGITQRLGRRLTPGSQETLPIRHIRIPNARPQKRPRPRAVRGRPGHCRGIESRASARNVDNRRQAGPASLLVSSGAGRIASRGARLPVRCTSNRNVHQTRAIARRRATPAACGRVRTSHSRHRWDPEGVGLCPAAAEGAFSHRAD